jgi:hypothetical protein
MNPNDLIAKAATEATAAYPVKPGDPSLLAMAAAAKRLSWMIGDLCQMIDEGTMPNTKRVLSRCEEIAYALRNDLERLTR